mgnify:CR=1 FL=1
MGWNISIRIKREGNDISYQISSSFQELMATNQTESLSPDLLGKSLLSECNARKTTRKLSSGKELLNSENTKVP